VSWFLFVISKYFVITYESTHLLSFLVARSHTFVGHQGLEEDKFQIWKFVSSTTKTLLLFSVSFIILSYNLLGKFMF
jgi:hypothetical protein